MPGFYVSAVQDFLKTLWEKEKLLGTTNFSFSHSVFYPFGELYVIFIKLKNCRLQILSVWKSLDFCRLGKGQTCVQDQSGDFSFFLCVRILFGIPCVIRRSNPPPVSESLICPYTNCYNFPPELYRFIVRVN